MFKIDIEATTQKYKRMLMAELGGKANLSPLRMKTVEYTAHLMARADEFMASDPDTPNHYYVMSAMQHQIERNYRTLGLTAYAKPLPGGKPKAEPAPKTVREYARGNGKGAIQ